MYGVLVYNMYQWYKSISLFEETRCDNNILKTLIDAEIDPVQATEMACTVIAVVGGPTVSQTSFVTIIVGLSTAVIGLYLNSGPKWSFTKSKSDYYQPESDQRSVRPENEQNWFGGGETRRKDGE